MLGNFWGFGKFEIAGYDEVFFMLEVVFLARRNFFKIMRVVDSERIKLNLTPRSESLFVQLVDFVESGSFTKSKHSKFICENWRLNDHGLSSLWESRTGQVKRFDTFRGQISDLSASLFALFPFFSAELLLASEWTLGDLKAVQEMELVINYLSDSNCSPSDLFIQEVSNYPDSVDFDQTYSVEDMKSTLSALKPFMRSNIYRLLDEVDIDQLKYILFILNKPIVKNKDVTVALEKLKILKALDALDTDEVTVAESGTSGEPQIIVREIPEKSEFRFGSINKLSALLRQKLETKVTESETIAYTSADEKAIKARKSSLVTLFTAMTEEGFAKVLDSTNPILLEEAVRESGFM